MASRKYNPSLILGKSAATEGKVTAVRHTNSAVTRKKQERKATARAPLAGKTHAARSPFCAASRSGKTERNAATSSEERWTENTPRCVSISTLRIPSSFPAAPEFSRRPVTSAKRTKEVLFPLRKVSPLSVTVTVGFFSVREKAKKKMIADPAAMENTAAYSAADSSHSLPIAIFAAQKATKAASKKTPNV